ncbi:unnamed protein product [Rotaria sordida]|uniref:F-box domain-containing protein n=1 Tax=Rotaria sordida TaxID=392033 RepID=A0A815RH97_9BILA|nr:unnamed protein product [Rotaria sordida]
MLPNELLLEIFGYINLHDLYYGFLDLNIRLNKLLRSLKKFSIIFEHNDRLMISLFARQIIRLVVMTWTDIDLKRFPNLCSLTLKQATDAQMRQIRYEYLSNLKYLTIASKFNSSSLIHLINGIFSNRFPSLHYVCFRRFIEPFICSWSLAPNLKTVCIIYCEIAIISLILASCPHLLYLQIELSPNNNGSIHFSEVSLDNHPLKRFILLDSYAIPISAHIDQLLSYMPNIERLYFEFDCTISLVNLMSNIANRLTHLRQFHCQITVSSIDGLDRIRRIHSCFNRIQWEQDMNGSLIIKL